MSEDQNAPKAWRAEDFENLLNDAQMLCGYVCTDGRYTEYRFHGSPENIANFIGSHPTANEIVVTDSMDRPILNTIGCFIDDCQDLELLGKIKQALVPIQRGEAKPSPFFCPTYEEVDAYSERRAAETGTEL